MLQPTQSRRSAWSSRPVRQWLLTGLYLQGLVLAFALPACAGPAVLPAASAVLPDPASGPDAPPRDTHIGSAAYYRSLLPSALLEQQAQLEYRRLVDAAVQKKQLLPATNPQVRRVKTIVDKLVPYSVKWSDRSKNWKWEIAVIRSPRIAALVLPSGKIVLYTGMLDRLKLNDDEIALLLGNGIAHAVREHARTHIGEAEATQGSAAPAEAASQPAASSHSASAAVAAPATASATASATSAAVAAAATSAVPASGAAAPAPLPLVPAQAVGPRLLAVRYSRDDETEADVIGADIASRAGYDPRAAVSLWRKLDRYRSARVEFVLAHPITPARLNDLVKRLPDMMQLYAHAIGKSVETLPAYPGVALPQARVPRSVPAPARPGAG